MPLNLKYMPLNFILIGRSGSGKGTQAKFLMRHFKNLFYISTGDLFRNLTKVKTDTGKKIKKILEQGGLPHDDLATSLWMHEIAYKIKENQGILADGFPRRLNEAKSLDKFLKFLGRKERTFYFLIDISRKQALNRLLKRRICKKCGQLIPWMGKFKKLKICNKCKGELIARDDDTLQAINNRLDYYEKRVTPVIKYYKRQNRLIRINGEQSPENVFREILKNIYDSNKNLGRN